jgi:hypothetical protein
MTRPKVVLAAFLSVVAFTWVFRFRPLPPADPSLIRGGMIVGEAKEAQGDLSGARDAFAAALRLFNEQYPKSYERPRYLIRKLGTLNQPVGTVRAAPPP